VLNLLSDESLYITRNNSFRGVQFMKKEKNIRIINNIPEDFDKIEMIQRIIDAGLLDDFIKWLRDEKKLNVDNIKIDEIDHRVVFEYAYRKNIIETYTDLELGKEEEK